MLKTSACAFLLFLVVCDLAVADLPTRFPPYPEVWDWSPSPSPKQSGSIALRRLPDGDVLVTYRTEDGKSSAASHTVSFFRRKQFPNVEAAFGGIYPPPDRTHFTKLANGQFVRVIAMDECARGLGSQVALEGPDGVKLAAKTLLLILHEPKPSPTVRCEERQWKGFPYSVAILRPTSVMPLADGTFLIADYTEGLVVRLDANLRTGSPLYGKRLFAVTPESLELSVRQYWRPAPEMGVDWNRFFTDLRVQLLSSGALPQR